MPLLPIKRAESEERLEQFHLWTQVDQRAPVSRGLRRLAFATAAVCAVVIAVAAAGWV